MERSEGEGTGNCGVKRIPAMAWQALCCIAAVMLLLLLLTCSSLFDAVASCYSDCISDAMCVGAWILSWIFCCLGLN